MRINSFVNRLILPCPLILSASTNTPLLPAVRLTTSYPKLTPCQLPMLQLQPQTNEGLSCPLLEAENAWHQCAAQVDMIIDGQERINAQSAANP